MQNSSGTIVGVDQYQLAGVPLPEPAGRPRRGEPVPRSGEHHRTARVTCVGRWAAGRTGERRSRGPAWRGGWSGWWCRSAGLQCSAVHSHPVQGSTEAGHRQPRPGEEQVVPEDGVESEEGGELHGETAGPGLGQTARHSIGPHRPVLPIRGYPACYHPTRATHQTCATLRSQLPTHSPEQLLVNIE